MSTVVYVGNFEPPHSTENEIRRAAMTLGHEVVTAQENQPETWTGLVELVEAVQASFVLWTRTRWVPPPLDRATQSEALAQVRAAGIPIIGYHLDIWWGLKRVREIRDEPFFTQTDLMCTADGGHDECWAEVGIDHVWFPPAISATEAARTGRARGEYGRQPVAFVGCWDGSYHVESTHRHALVAHLRARGDVSFWPVKGSPAIRGQDLADLYATVPVIVGDSCMVDTAGHYWSDRIPETLGRAGFLLHPRVDGLAEHFTDGQHLVCYEPFGFDQLDALIEHFIEHPDDRCRIAKGGQAHVRANHTYEIRVGELLDVLRERRLI